MSVFREIEVTNLDDPHAVTVSNSAPTDADGSRATVSDTALLNTNREILRILNKIEFHMKTITNINL